MRNAEEVPSPRVRNPWDTWLPISGKTLKGKKPQGRQSDTEDEHSVTGRLLDGITLEGSRRLSESSGK